MVDVLTRNQTFASPTEALKHYGKKGMKWGVRNDDAPSGAASTGASKAKSDIQPASEETKRFNAKKAAIGAGILLGVAGAGFAVYHVQKNGGLTSFSKGTTKKGEEAATSILKQPTSPILGTRGKNLGFRFLETGGLGDPYKEWQDAGFDGNSYKPFGRYGPNDSKVSLSLKDPEGRTDSAGRTIVHDIIVPSSMSHGINSEADVVSKIWPYLKPNYDRFYKESLKPKF